MAKPTIICVDDEKAVLNNLKEQLKREYGDQYSYEMAESAEDAFEIIGELKEAGVPIPVIISDFVMPGMKGDTFLMKVHDKSPEIRKVLLTGQADEKAVHQLGLMVNLFVCIYKPWSEKDLFNAIEAH